MSIDTLKVEESRINQIDENNIQFGRTYSDHMLIADYEDGQWSSAKIVPYGNISMSPSTTFIHYGQSIFEGIKAYKNQQGEIKIFRPDENWKRFNRSAERMGMPHVPEDIFMKGLKELVALDKDWVPNADGCSLYIRPFMFATDAFIGVKPAEQFRFMIISSPAGAYYNKPTRIYVQDEFVRAFPGGIGFTKAAGNYGAVMYPTQQIRQKGFDQNLWLDGVEKKYIQEIGTMNIFIVIGDKIVTPDLKQDTILAGVTRDSAIKLLTEKGYTVEERPISIDELIEAYDNGLLKEAFGAGTAAVIAPIAEFYYKGKTMLLPNIEDWTIAPFIKKSLSDIRYGRVSDTHQWMFPVC
ncbi:MAG: branched-chain amino acid aminotransferase [Chitinophagaceae bacterium]